MPKSEGTRFGTHSISYHWENVALPLINWKFMRTSTTALSRPGSGIAASIRCATNRGLRRFLPNWACPIRHLLPRSHEGKRILFFRAEARNVHVTCRLLGPSDPNKLVKLWLLG